MPRVDFRQVLDRDQMPDRSLDEHSDIYSFAFPLALDASALQVFVDGADGFYRYPQEYLPDAIIGAAQAQGGVRAQQATPSA